METTKNAALNNFFENLAKSGINLSLSTNKREIFKKELIKDLTDSQAKVFRRKIRKMLIAFAESVISSNGNVEMVNQFNALYTEAYAVNDYTLQSVCSDNMKQINREILQKALQICKPKPQPQKTTKTK